MPHSYEELRAAALDILTRRERVTQEPIEYERLSLGLGEVFARREGRIPPGRFGETYPLDAQDKENLLELFWDLFRGQRGQGRVFLGRQEILEPGTFDEVYPP